MATVNDLMLMSLDKAFKAAEAGSNESALTYVEIAKACASAIGTKGSAEMQVPTTTVKKEAPKVEMKSKEETENSPEEPKEPEKPKKAKVQKAPAKEEPEESQEVVDEWNQDNMVQYKEEITTLNRLWRYYKQEVEDGENKFNELVSQCTEGHATGLKEVKPSQIQMVVSFFKDILDSEKEI